MSVLEEVRVLVQMGQGWSRRAAVHLTRQALEQTVRRLLIRHGGAPDEHTSFTAQLLVLPELLGDAEMARRVAWTWAALSRASHHHTHELPPTADELQGWIATVDGLQRARNP